MQGEKRNRVICLYKSHLKVISKAAAVAASLALGSALIVGCSSTASHTPAPEPDTSSTAAADVEGYVTAAAYRAAEPAPEILGISGVSTNNAWTSVGVLDWSAPVYYIMGTDINSAPNPYMYNAVLNVANGNEDAQPTLVYTSRQGGPAAAMYEYGADADSDAVWNMLPDIIVGTGQGESVDYSQANYAPAAGEANGTPDYAPDGIKYDSTNIYTMIDTMYNLAESADSIVSESNGAKKLRYGNATDIARRYEQYVKGTQGYILSQLASGKLKTVALVSDYDAATGTYKLTQTGVAEGTATANRYLEATQFVATNIADGMETDPVDESAAQQGGRGQGGGRGASAATATVTQDQLADVDLILLGSQAGQENIASTEDILASFTDDMKQKTYWVNSDISSAGSMYGVVMNSVENAQNIGRILGCLYPEYIDQDQWIAYYYDNFYHLNGSDLASTMDSAMDGVRNWDAAGSELTAWTADDATGYDKAGVEKKLADGAKYIADNASSVNGLLAASGR